MGSSVSLLVYSSNALGRFILKAKAKMMRKYLMKRNHGLTQSSSVTIKNFCPGAG